MQFTVACSTCTVFEDGLGPQILIRLTAWHCAGTEQAILTTDDMIYTGNKHKFCCTPRSCNGMCGHTEPDSLSLAPSPSFIHWTFVHR
jgi:hypothetical protein